ncbi:flagellin [Salinibacter ruber]|uniref:flagellin N-terminal helical domain-containing protein n=1 Tax=Salinibacter ruber TaxID=146919 RepID=UPI00216A52B4|nr:flagellin [Salinibacter ruber]MCS3627528.1 flagellin [Salinibacter ruber]MCS3827612.1 flagellin [Salinibacter ruber]MCS4144436.1 flagellin [Salinibacter ruber]
MSTFSQINTNIQAQRAFQNLSDTSEELQSRQERLTTGLRINSASDDAAGFEIASQLEAKTGSQQQALRNIGDAKSTLSTAEGALDSQLSILQSAQEKATQAANGSLSQSEREAIGTELNALTQEIDDIAKNATFNGDQLLTSSSGSSVNLTFQTGAEQDTTFDVGISNSTASDLNIGTKVDPKAAGKSINNTGDLSGLGAPTVTDGVNTTGTNELEEGLDGGTFNVEVTDVEGNDSAFKFETQAGETTVSDISSTGSTNKLTLETNSEGGSDLQVNVNSGFADNIDEGDLENGETTSFQLQVVDQKNIGTRIAIGNGDQARTEIGKIENAIDTVTSQLSDLGASQNRLSFKESNLETTRTNLSAAQSRIEDADLAKEQTRVAKLQVQQQSGTAQLAQANAAGQSVLSLLGG